MKELDRAKRTSRINTWKPNKKNKRVDQDGQLFVCYFDKIFGQKKFKKYNKFMIKKGSYENQLPTIVKYTDFFMNCYDTNDELATAYLKIKFETDRNNAYTRHTLESYRDLLYNCIFTPSMVEKINRMVEENYLDDIEKNTEDKEKYLKSKKKHLESLEFTNQHIKILLRISFAMKIMSPAIFHYLALAHIQIKKDSEILFEFYKELFNIFGYSNEYELYASDNTFIQGNIDPSIIENGVKEGFLHKEVYGYETYYYNIEDGSYYTLGKINMYNKLYVYVKAKVLESSSNNATIFSQKEIFGIDTFTVINLFTKKVIISENMVKYKFNEHWDPKQKKYKENIVGLNKTILTHQLSYFLKDQYQKNIAEITNTKNSDGLSASDKMAMNMSKLDEGQIIMTDINLDVTIKQLEKKIDIPISDEEVMYYRENMYPDKIQIQLIYSYFAKEFGSYQDLNLAVRKDYIRLALMLKKKLLIENGYNNYGEDGKVYHAALPYILTGNVAEQVNTKIIRNNKFLSKIQESYLYQNLIENKYRAMNQINPDFIQKLLSQFINTKFTYVTYENPDLLGKPIEYSDDKISDELLFFLNSI